MVPHRSRAVHRKRNPVHVTVRVRRHVFNLRAQRAFRPICRALNAARDRFGMRVCHFSVQGNHLHLLVEAEDGRAITRGMKGLGVRVAKALNRVMSTALGREVKGAVLEDRYHARALRTPTEVARALRYVLRNHEKHAREWGERWVAEMDACSSANPEIARVTVVEAGTWLLRCAPA
jgi:REP element-mobilizing transposase RayT